MNSLMTITVSEELESLKEYLATQPAGLVVDINGPVPADRYLIQNSLILIVQQAQRHNLYPLNISISFLKYTVEINYKIQPRPFPNEQFPDMETLVALYRDYYNLPKKLQVDDWVTISIPLFI